MMRGQNLRCQVCKGYMHEFFECPTKRKCDEYAKKNNDQNGWGQWKWVTYYHKYDDVQKDAIRSLSRKWAPKSQKKYYNKKFSR